MCDIDPEEGSENSSQNELDQHIPQLVYIERTLAIIKPEGIPHMDDIEYRIRDEGFEILQRRTVHLTPEQASDFFQDQYGFAWFPLLIANISSAPIHAMCLAKPGAIEAWKTLMGPYRVSEARLYWPDSLRAKYGVQDNDLLNAVHGSDNPEVANREIHFFFPQMILEPLLRGPQVNQYLETIVHPTLMDGLNELCREKPMEPLVWLADWLLVNNPNRPKEQTEEEAIAAAAKEKDKPKCT